MNFILKMYAQDNPDEFKLIDPSIPKGEHPIQIWVENESKLCGKALKEYSPSPDKYLKKYYGWSKDN